MNAKHRKTLRAISPSLPPPSISFSDIEALIVALGGEVIEREGSRVKTLLRDE